MAVLAGIRSPAKLKATVKAGLLPMQKVSWVVSPLTLLFAQNFLPPTTWVPFFNLVAFGKRHIESFVISYSSCVFIVFGTYINTMVKRKRISEEAAKKD